jgi:hypothetical protein
MIEACDLVNVHTLQHGEAPATHKQGSQQIDFNFISRSLVIHVEECGILPFDSMLPSDHIPLYVDFNIATIFGHPVMGTEKADLRDLQLDNPRLIDTYESTLCIQFENHNVELRVATLFATSADIENNSSEAQFNQVDRDITRAMECAVNKS